MSRATSGGARRGRELVARLDVWADKVLQPLRGNRLADRLFYTASEAGNFSVVWHVAAWLPCLVRPSRAQVRRSVLTSTALALESVVVNGGVKSLFGRARPAIERSSTPHRLRLPQTSSFPSGHASAAMVAAAMLSKGRGGPVKVAAYGAAGVVCLSRVYVRIHHASDVVGGLLLGGVFGAILRRLLR